jgi:hypothetical protein
MISKYLVTGLAIAFISTATALASVSSAPHPVDPIELEIEMLTMSPGEHLLNQVLENHPIALISNWISK